MVRAAVNFHAPASVRRAHGAPSPRVLHLAPTRSAAVRLAAVAAAQRGPQLVVESTGRLTLWRGIEPPQVSAPLPAATVFSAVSAAIERARPDVVLIAGDDDAVLASALAASRAEVPIARLGA